MRLWRRLSESAFLRSAAQLSAGVGIAQLVLILISPVLTRIYGPEAFGVFAVIQGVVLGLSVFSTAKLELLIPAVKRSSTALRLFAGIVVLSLAVAVIMVAVIALSAEALSSVLSISSDAVSLLYLAPLMLLGYSTYTGLRYWMIRQQRFAQVAKNQIARTATNATVSLAAGGLEAIRMFSGLGLLLGQLAGDLIACVVLGASLRQRERRFLASFPLQRIGRAIRENRRMITTLFASQGIATLYLRIPILVIGGVYGPAAAGYYAIAERVVVAPIALVANALGDVYRQRAAATYFKAGRFDSLMVKTLKLTLAISVVPFALAILLAPRFTGVVLGDQWTDAGITIAIMLVSGFVVFSQGPVDKAAVIVGAHRYIMAWHLVRLLAEAALALLALGGVLTYLSYISGLVLIRSGLAVWDLVMEYGYARGRRASGTRVESS